VGGAGEVLHLAPRSVRDLIYSGRLPSVRLGRLHFVSAADLELERRRRLGLALPRAHPKRARPRVLRPRPATDPTVRARRAHERRAAVQRAPAALPSLPFQPELAASPATCAVCGRSLEPGARVFVDRQAARLVCARCGRRALLAWADERAREAAAARQLARSPASSETETARAA
jgi:hypothetical protein